jgi:hypothetical protein
MLDRIPKAAWFAAGLGILIGFSGLVGWSSAQPPHHQTIKSATHTAENKTTQDIAAEIVAYYTKVLAWFTGVLALASIGQGFMLLRADKTTRISADAAAESVKLARAEFIATHRPKITIHTAELRRDVSRVPGRQGEEYFLGASLLGFNCGESIAKNIEVRGQIFAGSNFVVDVQRPIVKTIPDVSSGIKLRAEIKSDIPIADALAGRRTGVDYYCIGWIAYWDENGHRRETGFCFRADFWPPPPASERWVRSGKPEYEYEY